MAPDRVLRALRYRPAGRRRQARHVFRDAEVVAVGNRAIRSPATARTRSPPSAETVAQPADADGVGCPELPESGISIATTRALSRGDIHRCWAE